MNSFLIKLILMPLIIAVVTLASRKWGNNVGGIIASLPWVAGPILVFISIEQGVDFATNAIPGVMVGVLGWLIFSVVYVVVGKKFNAVVSVIAGYAAYLILGVLIKPFIGIMNMYQWLLISILGLILGLVYFPKVASSSKQSDKKLKFEIPLRMLIITIFVVTITFFANILGPGWSGILTPFPIMTAVLAIFTHHTQGIFQVRKVFMGLFTGMFGFTLFLYLQAILLPNYGIFVSFSIGLVADIILTILMKFVFERFRLIR